MTDKFDELAKNMAQSVTRRGALKKFGLGITGIALAALGLANKVHARGQDCNQWHCADGFGDWDVYVCGGRKPKCRAPSGPCSCVLVGPVDCSYCDSKCC